MKVLPRAPFEVACLLVSWSILACRRLFKSTEFLKRCNCRLSAMGMSDLFVEKEGALITKSKRMSGLLTKTAAYSAMLA